MGSNMDCGDRGTKSGTGVPTVTWEKAGSRYCNKNRNRSSERPGVLFEVSRMWADTQGVILKDTTGDHQKQDP